MGTDLTILAERRRRIGGWERAEPFIPAWEGESWLIRAYVYIGRNYTLNDALFWGLPVSKGKTEEYAVKPVAPRRGIPEDAADETLDEAKEDVDAYGTSWATLAELEAFDWDQPVLQKSTRCVALGPSGERKKNRVPYGVPEESGWTPAGEPYTAPDEAVMQDFVRQAGETYREACPYFLNETLPKLRSFGPPNEVRIVFWFS